MGIGIFKNSPIGNFLFKKNINNFGNTNYQRIKHLISKNEKILDIGCGRGGVSSILKDKGYNITPIDVQDISLTNDIKPIIYDGENIPFEADTFDTAIIITVLHHTPNPEQIISEAKRVTKNIIIIEDIYENNFQKYLTFFMDNIMNLEFFTNPHSNKTDKQRKQLFYNLGLQVEYEKQEKVLKLFKQVTYKLEK